MNLDDLKAELSIKIIQFEQGRDAGLPHSELIQIYRQIKELQYQLLMLQVKETPNVSAETIE
jgi:hypothetical protein